VLVMRILVNATETSLGYHFVYCNGLGHVQPVSHHMNHCFVHVRRNAGHWCFGLHLSKYTMVKLLTKSIPRLWTVLHGVKEVKLSLMENKLGEGVCSRFCNELKIGSLLSTVIVLV